MKLKELIPLIGADDQNIVLIDEISNEWLGTFPLQFTPKQYNEYEVTGIMPDSYEGEGYGDGVVLKIWIRFEIKYEV